MLYLIRHAQSEANEKRIMASRLPYPLTAAGKADAALIAGELSEYVQITRIMSSPLLRAVQTAEAFSRQYNIPIEQDIRLAEQHLGRYSGMGYDEVKLEDQYEMVTENRWNWVPDGGGESYEMIARRVEEFFNNLPASDDGNTLIVTHAITFRLIRAVLENRLPDFPVSFPNNGEIWKVDFQGLGRKHSIESLLLGNSREFVHNP